MLSDVNLFDVFLISLTVYGGFSVGRMVFLGVGAALIAFLGRE